MTALVMDVTSDKDVAAAVRKVEAGGCLWAIVNNVRVGCAECRRLAAHHTPSHRVPAVCTGWHPRRRVCGVDYDGGV